MMTDLLLGSIFGVTFLGIGYLVGITQSSLQNKKRVIHVEEEKPVMVVKKKVHAKPDIELGIIKRPDAEELEKKSKPILKGEEEAWEESMGEMLDPIKTVFKNHNLHKKEGSIWTL